jgi:hypothetical protein
MGASRRAHHTRVAAERQAGIEATAMRIAQENQQKEYQAMIDALKPKAQVPDAAPRPVQSTLDMSRGGVRTARSTRGTVKGLSRGLAALRIPLNIGGGAGGGLNIG